MRLKLPVARSLRPIAVFALSVLAMVFSPSAEPDERLVEVTPENVPGVVLDLRYATTNNLTGMALYPEAKAYLRQETIRKLRRVERARRRSMPATAMG